MNPPRVLIVDDERANRMLLEVMLGPEGFTVQSASSGEEALRMVQAQPPDLILLDIMMPGMDGYVVAERLKTDPATKNIPIVMVTALDDRNARMLALNAGAEEFLTKPLDRAELALRVKNLLRLKAYGDYHDQYGQMLEGEIGARTADLVASERLYRSTFDAAPVGIIHVGLDGQWLRVNQRMCDLLGYSNEELQSPAIRKLVQVDDVAGEATSFLEMVAGTIDRHVIDEKAYRRRDGSVMCARVYVSVHRGSDGKPHRFIKVIEDITERRVLEAQLRQAGKLDAIGGLAAGIAHDFNNLLSVILSYSEMAALDLSDGDPLRDDLDQIHGAGMRAVDLTHQLLIFSRQQVLEPKVVNLGEIVATMEKMLRRLLGEDIELSCASVPSLQPILVDPGQMEQVIMNLAVNARDAMPRGGALTIDTADVVLDAAYAADHLGVTPGPHVMLSVADAGIGMDAETMTRMFEPFFTTKEVGKGTGLGLSTVFGIVRQSGGTIVAESEVGRGTTFKAFFPTADKHAVASRASRPQRTTLRGFETILLVEDDPSVRLLAHTILRKLGYHVLEAQSGGDAFLLCEQHEGEIHLLLTDVVMPRMSGRQLAERLLLVRPAMKVLYMSGYTNDEVVRSVRGNAIAFIEKPITPELLARKVRDMLG
jgi:two-component system, cell cycle sensor histidine kinase and response regulator CckA